MFAPDVLRALSLDRSSSTQARTIDITTTGARTGLSRRIEIWFHRVDGRWYLSSLPARPNWYANLRTNPRLTVHLKNGIEADLGATSVIITDPAVRRPVFEYIVDDLNQPHNPGYVAQPQRVEDWMDGSPLVQIIFDDEE